jgi:putative transposase
MKEWLTAAEIAALRLPGIPHTTRGVAKMADRQRWVRRDRAGSGGGSEFNLVMLPRDARIELAKRATGVAANDGLAEGAHLGLRAEAARRSRAARASKGGSGVVALSGRAEQRMDVALAILGLFRAYLSASGKPRTVARALFCEAWNAGRLTVEDDIRAARPTLSVPTLQRFERRAAAGGPSALAGRYGNRRGSGRIDGNPAIRQLVEGMVAGYPHVEAAKVMKALRARARLPDGAFAAGDLPSFRTLQRWLQKWRRDNDVALLQLADPDAHRSRTRASFGSAGAEVAELNGLWEMDSTPGDVMLKDGRHSLIGCIDVWSRRFKLLVARTSRSVAVAGLVRRCIDDWGLPRAIRTDNGADYVSRHIKRALAALEIHHDVTPPFSPERKPFIERALGTFSHDILELLEGYIGHDVAERQALRARRSFAERLMKPGEVVDLALMTAAELQDFVDRWTDDVYGMTPHAGLAGVTPRLRAASWTGAVRRVPDDRGLDILLSRAPASQGNEDGWRTVGKKGLAIDGGVYIAAELGPYVARRVRVLYDPTELGRVIVFNEDGNFVCIAEDPSRTGIDRRSVAIAARQLQRRKASEDRRYLQGQARAAKIGGVVREILDDARAISAKVVPLPASTPEVHVTPALEAAAEAAAAIGARPPSAAPDQVLRAKVVSLFDAPPAEPVDESAQLWSEVQALDGKKARGELTAEESDRLIALNRLPQIKARRLYEELEEVSQPKAAG